MSIISQETWDNMPKEEKEAILKRYIQLHIDIKNVFFPIIFEKWTKGQISELEQLFGKENLKSETIAEKMETQNTEWNMCTEQEQQNILDIYNNHLEWLDVINALENKFGKHNLNSKPKIRTWKDVEGVKDSYKSMVGYLSRFSNDAKLNKKLAATFQIQHLIELGYGGMVSEEEWRDEENYKYVVLPSLYEEDGFSFNDVRQYQDKQFIVFRTSEQREEFMSYSENVKLIEQYNML